MISRKLRFTGLLFVILFALSAGVVYAQGETISWETWLALNILSLDDDNSGATFAISAVDDFLALEIIPSGSSDETKLAYPASGAELWSWVEAGQLQISLYLPEENTLNPDNFFSRFSRCHC
ncbi:MAG: hypothetical protein UZ15_CFX003001345 [Chloroflexi bacterium OLB15]|nr:MAG: hypothetical protein UZ15_CFX003001345 [Chloroflexi bacterium OLB15]